MADAQTLNDIEGVVKWFDARKGFGFIVGPEGQDIFVHFSVIDQTEGFRALRDGERVLYSAQDGDKGWSATKAKSLSTSGSTAAKSRAKGPLKPRASCRHQTAFLNSPAVCFKERLKRASLCLPLKLTKRRVCRSRLPGS